MSFVRASGQCRLSNLEKLEVSLEDDLNSLYFAHLLPTASSKIDLYAEREYYTNYSGAYRPITGPKLELKDEFRRRSDVSMGRQHRLPVTFENSDWSPGKGSSQKGEMDILNAVHDLTSHSRIKNGNVKKWRMNIACNYRY